MDTDISQFRALWARVIWLAMIDGRKRKRDMMWFRTRDFEDVCDLAGVCPIRVRRIVMSDEPLRHRTFRFGDSDG